MSGQSDTKFMGKERSDCLLDEAGLVRISFKVGRSETKSFTPTCTLYHRSVDGITLAFLKGVRYLSSNTVNQYN